MTRRGWIVALWIAFVFVAWNVVFDRQVTTAAIEFTREQIVRAQQGGDVISLHEGFTPQVRAAALTASLWVSPLVVAGALALSLTSWRTS